MKCVFKKGAYQDIELVELQKDDSNEKLFSQLESDMNEITLCLNEFNRFSEMSFDNSRLTKPGFGNTTQHAQLERIVEFDDLEVTPKSELEAALEEYSNLYDRFRKVFIIIHLNIIVYRVCNSCWFYRLLTA